MRRVAFVDHAEELGGAEKSLTELVGHLDRARFEPVVFCTDCARWLERPELGDVRKASVFQPGNLLKCRRDELCVSFTRSAPKVLGGLAPILSVRRALKQMAVDLVHTNTLKAHLLGGVGGRLAGKPVVWHVRDILEDAGARAWLRRVAWYVRPRVIAISEAVAAQFQGAGLDVRVIHNGIPLERFTPGEPPAGLAPSLGLGPQDELICVVGRLTPWKGHRTLLQAMCRVREARPRAKLIVVGEVAFWEDSYEEELRSLAQSLGLADRVVWAGFREDVPDLLRLCDVFVLPSVNEPFGRVIIEAMAAGKPVVATRSGGVPEIVVEGETGLLVPPGDEAALAGALVELLADPARALRMGAAGTARARERFDVTRVAASVQQVYEEVLAGSAPRQR